MWFINHDYVINHMNYKEPNEHLDLCLSRWTWCKPSPNYTYTTFDKQYVVTKFQLTKTERKIINIIADNRSLK